jgi:DNA-binding NarL/FixJ family response regulator
LGMGLFIVKSIVELLKGRIEVKSILNEGTEITVSLPLEVAGKTEPVSIPDSGMATFKKDRIKTHEITYSAERKNIFIVEDNPEMRNYLAEELNELYNVFIAKDGIDAIDMLKTAPNMDIILSDVMMDRMDGHAFFASISKNDQYSNIPFIFLTAKSNVEKKLEMLTKGVIDYLYKPFSIDELKAKIQSVLINSYNQRTAALKNTMMVIQNQIMNGSVVKSGNGKWDTFELKKREYDLTERQIEIILLVEKGLEYKQIAEKLNISVKTTHRHIQNLFEKFGVHSKMELMKAMFD